MKRIGRILPFLWGAAAFAVYLLPVLRLAVSQADMAARRAPIVSALRDVGMSCMEGAAGPSCLSLGGAVTVGHLSADDDYLALDGGASLLLRRAETAEYWHVSPVTPEQFAASLPEEYAFLRPACTFDAWYARGDGSWADGSRAWFDEESWLFIHLNGQDPEPMDCTVFGVDVTGVIGWDLSFRDGVTYRAFIVPEGQREAALSAMQGDRRWRDTPIPCEEYVALHQTAFSGVPWLFPAEDIVFDQWVWQNDYRLAHPEAENGWIAYDTDPWADLPDGYLFWGNLYVRFPQAMRPLNACGTAHWSCALYDAETGLLIHYEFALDY